MISKPIILTAKGENMLFVFAFLVFCACIAFAIAQSKNRLGWPWFFLGLCFGPFSWAVALMPKGSMDEYETDTSVKETTKPVDAAPKGPKKTYKYVTAKQIKTCPTCNRSEVTKAYLADGGMGDWCLHCNKPI